MHAQHGGRPLRHVRRGVLLQRGREEKGNPPAVPAVPVPRKVGVRDDRGLGRGRLRQLSRRIRW